MKKLLFLTALVVATTLCTTKKTYAQDIHWSSIHASPVYLNPAMTGLFNGGNTRFIGLSRSQWSSFTNGFKTISGSIDTKLMQTGSGAFFGGGLQLYADKAGDLDFRQTHIGTSLSYVQAINKAGDSYLALGFQAAYNSQSFDMTKMVGFDQETSITYGDIDSKLNYVDVSVGAAWYYTFSKNSYYYLGASMFHVNNPNVSFFDTDPNGPQIDTDRRGHNLYKRLTIHGGANLQISKYVTLQPSFIYFDQGPHQQVNAGTYFKIQKSQKGRRSADQSAFYFGAWVRFYQEASLAGIDAVIPSVRADFNNTIVSLSFDINISELKVVSTGSGGPELSVIKIIGSSKRRSKTFKVKCPDF